MLEQGGNQKFRDFMQQYDLHKITDMKVLYNSKAAAFYRKRNQASSANQPFSEDEPSYEEGRTLLDGRQIMENGLAQAKETEPAPMPVKRKENVP